MSGNDKFDLEAEVRDLAARRDILDAIHRYMRGQDRLIPELQRSAFHDGAYVDCGPFAGLPDDYVNYAQSMLAGCAATHHMIGQVQIQVDGDKAYGEVYFIAWHRLPMDGQQKDMIFGGRYIDEYARKNGEWRIWKRREIADWTRTDPPAELFFELEKGCHRPGHREADFSVRRDWPAWP